MSVASKNLFDLLGNDADGDSAPAAPVKTVEKTSTHTAKRNTDGVAPSKAPVAGARRSGAQSGNDAAFRDRNAGSERNRGKNTDEASRGGPRGGSGARGRGGRGARHSRQDGERHTQKTNPSGGSDKTAAQAWGAAEGQAELKDEQAGEEQAQTEQKEAAVEGETAEEKQEEEEDKHVSFADYLAQQAEKKAALEAEAALKLRQANEGTKENKKWATAKPLAKEEGEDYFAPTSGKSKRERERKVKQVVEIDQRYVEPERTGGAGGRGGRGGPRGGARGDGARGAGRGRGAPRGAPRGGRGEGAPRAAAAAALNPTDDKAFPTLGSK